MFGDVLKEKIGLLSHTTKYGDNRFWIELKNIAAEDIKECFPNAVDSVNAIRMYYEILVENEKQLPKWIREESPSNGQKKYRIANRNMWTSNAFHKMGLANVPGIKATRLLNEEGKGTRILYMWETE